AKKDEKSHSSYSRLIWTERHAARRMGELCAAYESCVPDVRYRPRSFGCPGAVCCRARAGLSSQLLRLPERLFLLLDRDELHRRDDGYPRLCAQTDRRRSADRALLPDVRHCMDGAAASDRAPVDPGAQQEVVVCRAEPRHAPDVGPLRCGDIPAEARQLRHYSGG